jgi:hypothetical protein
MILHLSSHAPKKIFARARQQESAMSRAKIAPAAARRDAVRGRSSSSLPGAEKCPGPLVRAALVACRCTPARLMARMMDRQCPVRNGSGGVVLVRTASEPRQNRQYLEIITQSCPVLGFSEIASRDAHARAYTGAHAHGVRLKLRTTEPQCIITYYHRVSSSEAVLRRFWSEPALARSSQSRRKPPFLNKIGGGYGCSADLQVRSWLVRGRREGRAVKTFGLRDPGGAIGSAGSCSRPVDQARAGQGGNGGFARVSGWALGHVGTGMLERSVERRGKRPFLARRRQLSGLTGRPGQGVGGRRSAGRGGRPPIARRPFPSPFAPAIFPIWIAINDDCPAPFAERRQIWSGKMGSGDRLSRSALTRASGQGSNAGWGLCRSGETSGGRAHVN